jgi:hypothetical protein
MPTTKANNRALTLDGANKIFDAIGIEIQKHDLGYYYCVYLGNRWENPTLTGMCRTLVLQHMAHNR